MHVGLPTGGGAGGDSWAEFKAGGALQCADVWRMHAQPGILPGVWQAVCIAALHGACVPLDGWRWVWRCAYSWCCTGVSATLAGLTHHKCSSHPSTAVQAI